MVFERICSVYHRPEPFSSIFQDWINEKPLPVSLRKGLKIVADARLFAHQDFEDLDRGGGDRGPPAEDGGRAVPGRLGVSQCGELAARAYADGLAAQLLQLGDDLRHQRKMAGSQRRDADDMHVVLHGLLRSLLRSLEQRPHVDVEADVGITRGDYFGTAVVAVLSQFRNHDTGLTPLFLGEFRTQLLGACERFVVFHF